MLQAIENPPMPIRGLAVAWCALLLFETIAQVGLKGAGDQLANQAFGLQWFVVALSSPWCLMGIVGYLGAFAAWMALLDKTPLSFGFPLTGSVMLALTLASYLVFGETISGVRMAGLGLILAGLFVMAEDGR